VNATIRKFGWPATLLREFDHWLVLLRPTQPTLGSLVLAARSDATAFGDLPGEAYAELKPATEAIERALAGFAAYTKLNYLMLMMVDPHVHFHVIPRYEGVRRFGEVEFADRGWPGVPDLSAAVQLSDGQRDALADLLREALRPRPSG
jgi:diadenosine tetraphosphate (Ap4A) HIT family hydrolase